MQRVYDGDRRRVPQADPNGHSVEVPCHPNGNEELWTDAKRWLT
jgi:hypothetical protein